MKKYEVINFRNFLRNDYKKPEKKVNNIAILSLSVPALFSPPPMIVTGYLLVMGFGALAISGVVLEKFFAKRGNSSVATAIGTFFNILLPAICFVALIFFVIYNPLLRW